MAETGKPYAVLLKNGRALALEGAIANAPALMVTWFLGSETGSALADLLFGRAAPSARLPVSFPQRSGQEPFYYARKTTGRPNGPGELEPYKAHYRGVRNTALFPFGHGLTYGRIAYSGLDLGGGRLAWDGEITCAPPSPTVADVPPTRWRSSTCATSPPASPSPMRLLKAFRRVSLAPGGSQQVSFTLRRTISSSGRGPAPNRRARRFFACGSHRRPEADGVSGVFTLDKA